VRLRIKATSPIHTTSSKCGAQIESKISFARVGRRSAAYFDEEETLMTDERIKKEQYRQRVRTDYCQFEADGITVDEDAPVILAPGSGAWVQAWVWISELEPDPTDD
jgi:hypothetical protein